MSEIKLTLTKDGEVREVWDIGEWDLDKSIAAQVLLSEIKEEVEKAEQDE